MSADKTRKSHKKLGQYWNYIEIYLSTEFSRNTQIMLAKHRCSAIVTRWTCVVFHRSFFFFFSFPFLFFFSKLSPMRYFVAGCFCYVNYFTVTSSHTLWPLLVAPLFQQHYDVVFHVVSHSSPRFSSRAFPPPPLPPSPSLLICNYYIITSCREIGRDCRYSFPNFQLIIMSLARSLERVYSFLHCLTDRFIFPHFVPIPAFFCLLFSRPLFLLLHLCFPLSITIRRR